jgi:hypothetical protein
MSDNGSHHVQDAGMRKLFEGNTVRKGGVNQVRNTARPAITPRSQTKPPSGPKKGKGG